MLNDIFLDKSFCDGIGLKSFCELNFKIKSVFAKGIQYWV